MHLSTLLGALPPSLHARIVAPAAAPDVVVRRVTDRVQEAGADDVFVAIKGAHFDGHDHLPLAAAVVTEREVSAPEGVVVVRVTSTVQALGWLCAEAQGRPSDAMKMVGVTGTNGKTSVTYLVAHFARAAGMKAGVIGTTGHLLDGEVVGEGYTTPTAPQLQRLLATFFERGAELVAMEVSSIGLAAHRVDGTTFTAAGYTNLTRDHIDYHGTMEAYAGAKTRLFTELLRPGGVAVLNRADPVVRALGDELLNTRSMLEIAEGVSVEWVEAVEAVDETIRGMTVRVVGEDGAVWTTTTQLIGAYNRENIACAWALARAAGVTDAQMARSLPGFAGVPGRLERVTAVEADFAVFVDYAHTDDALARVLDVLRPHTLGRLIAVFGCGGDRDPGKRPAMGLAATRADLAIVTSDNPRSEDPLAIIAAILPSLAGHPHRVEPDRRTAIALALNLAEPGDVILIAGKGHETTQTIGDRVLPFDDRLVSREFLA